MGQRLAGQVSSRLAAMRSDYAFATVDAALLASAYLLVFVVTREPTNLWWPTLLRVLVVAPAVHLACNAAFGLYGRVWQHAGIDEARQLILAGSCVIAILGTLSFALGRVPAPIVVLGPAVATFLTGVSRFRSRLFSWQRATRATNGARVVVIGAGRTGASLVNDLRHKSHQGYVPVAVVDDDARLHGRTVGGVPIVGGMGDLDQTLTKTSAHEVVLAIPSAAPELVRRAARAAEAAGLSLKVVPALRDVVAGASPMRQVRKARIEDLLGRKQVVTDLAAVNELVSGRVVLLTGAGGSIGAEIARQVARLSPSLLLLLDHDETHLHDALARIDADAAHPCVQVLADIRDDEGVEQIFSRYRPEIVFHAAAHKHVPILEAYPLEAVRTNVFGTANLLAAATRVGTERFVFISTDKAVRPSSVLGASKRLGEQLVAAHARPHGRYCSVRFGNVLGSRGSVVPTFDRQIAEGGPVTVTDPEMTRFFMSVEEAVQLVLQAGVFTKDNDLFMLEMGSPIRIVDLARQMIRLSGYSESEVGLTFLGARPGEKQAEELHAPSEAASETPHPSIARLTTTGISGEALRAGLERLRFLVDARLPDEARDTLFSLVASADELTPPAPRTLVLPEARKADKPTRIDLTVVAEVAERQW